MATHEFDARVSWKGTTKDGYANYNRDHLGATPPAVSPLSLSAAAVFNGDPALTNPEQLLALAASSCLLLTFLAIAASSNVDVLEYEDDAVAQLSTDKRPIRIERIQLRPRITVAGVSEERAIHLVEKAHRDCYIANSLNSEVSVTPTIVVTSWDETEVA